MSLTNRDLDIYELLEEIEKYNEIGRQLSEHISQLPMAFYEIANNMIGECITHESALDEVEKLDRINYIHINDTTRIGG